LLDIPRVAVTAVVTFNKLVTYLHLEICQSSEFLNFLKEHDDVHNVGNIWIRCTR